MDIIRFVNCYFVTELTEDGHFFFIFLCKFDWNDIKDDIHEEYDDCCSKQVLCKELHLTNTIETINAYKKLQSCLEALLSSDNSVSSINGMNKIRDDIIKVFTKYYDINVAKSILKSFQHIIDEEQVCVFILRYWNLYYYLNVFS